jgi:choline transport protein
VCHVVFFVISIVTLAAMAEKSSPSYVFNTLTHDKSGWGNSVVAWGIGLLTVTYPLTGTCPLIYYLQKLINVLFRLRRRSAHE